MKVELLHSSPLWVAAKAIRKCWASEDKSDTGIKAKCSCCSTLYVQNEMCTKECPECECDEYTFTKVCGPKDKELIHRVGNKFKHASTLEHLVYTFDIDGISRACLQEVARHRMASYSVKSTRYTLKELKEEEEFINQGYPDEWERVKKYLVTIVPSDQHTNDANIAQLNKLRQALKGGLSNDKAKYLLPEAYKTSLVMTINARSLQNFLALRTSKSALWEIQSLAKAMYDALPEEHKYLFEDSLSETYHSEH